MTYQYKNRHQQFITLNNLSRLFLLCIIFSAFFSIFLSKFNPIFANTPAALQILNPSTNGEFADSNYTINWIDSDPDNLAQIDLYYTPDNTSSQGTLIISGLSEESSTDSYVWDLGTVAPGSYFIRGYTFDDVNEGVNAWSPGKLYVVENANIPQFKFITPSQTAIPAQTSYTITWIDYDADSNAAISLYYDTNNSGANGTLITSGISEDNSNDSHVWDTSGFTASQELWVYAVISDSSNPAQTVYSTGSVSVGSNTPPTFAFVQPNGINDQSSGAFTIEWADSDPDDNALISLYYSLSTSITGTLIASDISEDSSNDTQIWDTTQVADGDYYIKAVISDQSNSPVTVWSSNKITVTTATNVEPLLQVLSPDKYGAIAGTSFSINWYDYDPDSQAEIKLYYTPDNSGSSNDTLIVSGLAEESSADSHVWNLNGITPGSYYIKGNITDNVNTPIDTWSLGKLHIVSNPNTPQLIFNEPAGNDDYPENSFTIKWIDQDEDSNALIDLYYDTNNTGADGTLISASISEDSSTDSFLWDTSGFTASQQLWVYAVLSDGINSPVTVYSPGPVTVGGINNPPSITIIEPDGSNDFGPGSFTITWSDFDPDDNARISFYYAETKTGPASLIVSDIEEDDSADSYTWNTSGVTPGTYYIKAFISDGYNPAVIEWSTGIITVTDAPNVLPQIEILQPDGVDDVSGSAYTITWTDSDPDSSALISLYYAATTAENGTLIASNISEDSDTDAFFWDISAIVQGEFYIRAVIDDSVAAPVSVYSPGKITIPLRSNVPTLDFIEPQNSDDTSYSTFTIKWAAFDTDSTALISLYFDNDASGADGSLIAQNISENDGVSTYLWNTSGLGNNIDLWVYGIISDGINAPVTVYSTSPVRVIESTNTTPEMTIIEPDGMEDSFNSTYTITWSDSDPDNDAKISLYYSAVTYAAGKLIVSNISEDSATNSYTWNTTGVTPGIYYIRGSINDGVNPAVNAWSPGTLTLLVPPNTPPTIQILEPDGADDTVSTSYNITWSDSDPDDDARISLYYSETTGSSGTLIISDISEDNVTNSHTWDTSNITPGTYYIRAVIADTENSPSTSWSAGVVTITAPPNTPPTLSFIQPLGSENTTYQSFSVTWTDFDPDDNALISLYYSPTNLDNGTLIVSGLPEDDTSNSYQWQVAGVTPGTYYVRASISDGVNQPVTAWSTGTLTVIEAPNAPPQISIINPAGLQTAQDYYTISWTDSDPDNNALISLYYTVTPGADETLIASNISEDSSTDAYTWDTQNIIAGTWFIKALISDNKNQPVEVWSSGSITVTKPLNQNPSIQIYQPDGIDDRAFSSYTISWLASDGDDNAHISLYYDSDDKDFNGTLITDALYENSDSSCIWDVTSMPAGTWYVYAVIDDSTNAPVMVYSKGPLVIDRTGNIRFVRVSNRMQNSAAITWTSDLSGTGTVYYGTDKTLGQSKAAAIAKDHFITLTGLLPSTDYFFKVTTESNPIIYTADNRSLLFKFRTANLAPAATSKVFSGILKDPGGLPLAFVPVFMTAKKTISSKPLSALAGTEQTSEFISTVTGADGSFTLDTSNLTDSIGNSFDVASGDEIILTSKTASAGTASKSIAFNPDDDTSSIDLIISGDDNVVKVNYSLAKGFNIVSFPFTGISSMTARTVMTLYPNMVAFYKFNSDVQTYSSCIKIDGSTFLNDFTLSEREAYFVKTSAPAIFTFESTGRIDTPPTLSLKRGFNLTTIPFAADPPFNMSTSYDSKAFLNQAPKAAAFYLFKADTGQYQSTLRLDESTIFGETLEIEGSKGFFIKFNKDTLFNPLR